MDELPNAGDKAFPVFPGLALSDPVYGTKSGVRIRSGSRHGRKLFVGTHRINRQSVFLGDLLAQLPQPCVKGKILRGQDLAVVDLFPLLPVRRPRLR
jgi:hypothetical protein